MTAYGVTDSVTIDGVVDVTPAAVPSATVTVFTASFVNAVFCAPNPNRSLAIFTNDDFSSGSIYVKFGPTASTGSYSVKLRPGGYYEIPVTYSGEIDGVWDTMSGTLMVTEFRK